jgi:hypothetical protein
MSGPSELGSQDPRVVGPYRLLKRLGTGGQGTVYLGTDGGEEPVAVKVLDTNFHDTGRLKTALNRELASAQSVAGFVTAQVITFDLDADPPYIVTEFVDGPTLYDEVREHRGPLRGSRLADVAIQTVIALEAIHAANVIHLDFKPGNIMLGPGGVKVIDFGIARAWDEVYQAASRVFGSAHFMSPEQVNNRPLGPSTDMFSWGSTMVFAATGDYPFPGFNPVAVGLKVVQDEPDLHGFEGPLADLIRACLHKDPSRRPTAAQVRQALMAPATQRIASTVEPPSDVVPLQEGALPTAAVPPPDVPRRRGRGRIGLIAALVVLVLLAAAGGAYLRWSGEDRKPAPTEADPQLQVLQTFAGARSLADCTAITANPKQVLRRSCTSGGADSTYSLFKPGERDKERANVARLHDRDAPADCRRQPAMSPDGRHGEYIEYVYQAGDDGKWYVATWWDDGITNPQGAAVMTMRKEWDRNPDDPARPLREAWLALGFQLSE